jgi:predicted dehydrogenase
MSNRREFLGSIAAAGAGRVMGANNRVRFGLIGAGGRGKEDLREALRCPDVEAVAVADVYTRRLDEAKAIVPGIQTYRDYRQLLADKTIDAVVIATPQHQHVLSFIAAIQAGKDVYQEKTMAFRPDHARRMRRALEGSGRVVQIGMQMNSGAGLQRVKELVSAERMGTLTAIGAHHFRNAPYGGWMRQVPPDCDEQHIDWPAFQAEAAPHPFDPQRYLNWRFYWDYSGGNVFENMVHEVGFWYAALGLQIPRAVTMTGANYLSPKMEVPDAMNVVMDQPEKILFTWNSVFSNNYYGEGQDYLFGTKGTLIHFESDEVRYLPQGAKPGDTAKPPEAAEYRDYTVAHFQNFFDCVRSRKETVCPFDLGFRTAIACQMAITSYRRQTTVRWDPETEEIV